MSYTRRCLSSRTHGWGAIAARVLAFDVSDLNAIAGRE